MCQQNQWHTGLGIDSALPYNKSINRGDPMDDTITAELRSAILEEIESMDIEFLKRIAYECRCEEKGIIPDKTYTHW